MAKRDPEPPTVWANGSRRSELDRRDLEHEQGRAAAERARRAVAAVAFRELLLVTAEQIAADAPKPRRHEGTIDGLGRERQAGLDETRRRNREQREALLWCWRLLADAGRPAAGRLEAHLRQHWAVSDFPGGTTSGIPAP